MTEVRQAVFGLAIDALCFMKLVSRRIVKLSQWLTLINIPATDHVFVRVVHEPDQTAPTRK